MNFVQLPYQEALTQQQWEPVHDVTEVPDDVWCVDGSQERRNERIEVYVAEAVRKVPNPLQGRRVKYDPIQKVFSNEDLMRTIFQYCVPYLFDYAPWNFPFKAILYYNRDLDVFERLMAPHHGTDRKRYAQPYSIRLVPSLQMCTFDLFETLQAVIPHVKMRLSGETGDPLVEGAKENWTELDATVRWWWLVDVKVNPTPEWKQTPGVHFCFRKSKKTKRWCLKSFTYFGRKPEQTSPIAFYLKDEGETFN